VHPVSVRRKNPATPLNRNFIETVYTHSIKNGRIYLKKIKKIIGEIKAIISIE